MHAHLSPLDRTLQDLTRQALAWCVLEPVTDGASQLLTLWPDEARARAAGSGRTFEVEDVLGQATSGAARWASTTEFDGPRSAVQIAADQRANRERIWPAASQVPGTLGALVLRADDGAMVVVALVEHEQALAATPPAILSTPLLPGEDLDLLRGPDRSASCRLDDHGVAALLASARTTVGAGR